MRLGRSSSSPERFGSSVVVEEIRDVVGREADRAGGFGLGLGNAEAAIRAFERAARHDPDYLPEVLPSLLTSYDQVGDLSGARAFLSEMCEHYRGIAPVLALTKLVERQDGVAAARAYLARQ